MRLLVVAFPSHKEVVKLSVNLQKNIRESVENFLSRIIVQIGLEGPNMNDDDIGR
jgi:hypothetical protein